MNQQISNLDRTIPCLPTIPDSISYQIDDEKILEPNCNDVLLGRGNFAKRWSGNEFYRYLIQNKKYEYVVAKASQKLPIALEIIDMVRSLSPPGRFLVKNKKTGLWCKVDDKKAIRKTRQALREDAPDILKEVTPSSSMKLGNIDNDEECFNFLVTVSSSSMSIKIQTCYNMSFRQLINIFRFFLIPRTMTAPS